MLLPTPRNSCTTGTPMRPRCSGARTPDDRRMCGEPIARPPALLGRFGLLRHPRQDYADAMKLTRITIDPGVCTGKPCIRGLRFPVARLLGLLAAGSTRDQILAAYPYLEPEDIDEALQYAALLAEDETVELAR